MSKSLTKKLAVLALCAFVILLPTTSVLASEPDAVILAFENDDEVVVTLSDFNPAAPISIQAFYTAPDVGAVEVLDYFDQYVTDGLGGCVITYPTNFQLAPGGVIKVIIGGAGLGGGANNITRQFVIIGFGALDAAILAFEGLVEADYKPDTWAAALEAYQDAKAINRATVTQAEVDALTLALNNAIAAIDLLDFPIIFNANGGNSTMPNEIIKLYETKQLPKCTITRTSYSFAGWNTEPNAIGGTAYPDEGTISGVTATVNLYAQWVRTAVTPGPGPIIVPSW